ncbi:MAG TPA: hypothetical protein VJ824_06695 [Bacillota bacterium]|nr:hypothetical protein [Bacillota bacterium]
MKKDYHPLDEINLIGQIADLKEVNYKNTLVFTALVELLVEKGILTRNDIINKAKSLEVDLAIHFVQQKDLN